MAVFLSRRVLFILLALLPGAPLAAAGHGVRSSTAALGPVFAHMGTWMLQPAGQGQDQAWVDHRHLP